MVLVVGVGVEVKVVVVVLVPAGRENEVWQVSESKSRKSSPF